jgi:hypothetical protein
MTHLPLAADDSAFGTVNDFFDSDTWLLIRNLSLFFVVVFWAATAYWVYKDARRRVEDPWMVAMAAVLGIVPPFLGPIIYMFFRPPEYLEDVRERELEIAAAEARLATLEHVHCQYCGFEVEKTFLRCPSCLRRLKEPCTVCGKPLDPRWKICPYCEAEVGQPVEGTRRRPRRAAAAAGAVPPRQAAPRPSPSGRPGGTSETAAVERPARAGRDRPQSAG